MPTADDRDDARAKRMRCAEEDAMSFGPPEGAARPPPALQPDNEDGASDVALEPPPLTDLADGSSGGGEDEAMHQPARVALAADLDAGIEDELAMRDELQVAARAETPEAAMRALQAMRPASFLPSVVTGGPAWWHVVIPNREYVPPIGDRVECYAPSQHADAAAATKVALEPTLESTASGSRGTILMLMPWMGGGKTTSKQEYQKRLLRANPLARTLDLDCNKVYSISNAVNAKKTAVELCDEGRVRATAAGYLDEDRQEVLAEHPAMVNVSFESVFLVEGQRFDLVTLDETSALAIKIGGKTMPHFECVAILRALLDRLGTRVLALDAAAGFKMSDTEPCTIVEHLFKLIAPKRAVLSAALDPAQMPGHLRRKLRVYYGAEKGHTEAWEAQLESAARAWQADHGQRVLIAVGTRRFGKDVMKRLQEWGVPCRMYHGGSKESTRLRDLADPGVHWKDLGAIVFTTVVGRGVDLPPSLAIGRVLVAMDRCGCDFGDQFQSMLRARHVHNRIIDVLLVEVMSPASRQRLVQTGRRKPLVRPTYQLVRRDQVRRRGFAMRAAERQARAAGVVNATESVTDALLNVMAHGALNREMQLVDPVYVVQRYAKHYSMPLEPMGAPADERAEDGHFELDVDDDFDVRMSTKEKWAHVAREIRERGEDGFLGDRCWTLADENVGKPDTTKHKWLVAAYHALKHIGQLPSAAAADHDEGDDAGDEDDEHGNDAGDENDEHGDDDDGGDDASDEDVEHGDVAGNEDPLVALLNEWLGDCEVDAQNLTPALQLQAHARLFTPKEQMRNDDAAQLEARLSRGKRGKHPFCELGLGQKMYILDEFCKRCIEPNEDAAMGGANLKLVDVANRQILKRSTPEDTDIINCVRNVNEQLGAGGKTRLITDSLRELARAVGLKLVFKKKKGPKQADGTRPHLVCYDPGIRFERVLPDVVNGWLVWCPLLDAKVSVADWQHAHDEHRLEQAEGLMAADEHDYREFFAALANGVGNNHAGAPRVELIDDRALQHEIERLKRQHERGAWMEAVTEPQRSRWSRQQHDAYKRHLKCSNALQFALAIDQRAEPANEHDVRELYVGYHKNSLSFGRRTADHPSMQHCPSSLRRVLCRARYHDVDIVSAHPTLMWQVVQKMRSANAIAWDDALEKLREYAELDADGKPAGRMPLLERVADHFGIDRGIAKDVCKVLVLRVLNGGSMSAWCREMGYDEPAVEQADLLDLTEAARIVRNAFFAMLERDHPGQLERLREQVWATMEDKHMRAMQAYNVNKGATPRPQPPSAARRDRMLFSLCMFDLEDRVLDCIDRHLQQLGWTVASLIYDGALVERSTDGDDLTEALRSAEAAVEQELGYKVAIVEKPMGPD